MGKLYYHGSPKLFEKFDLSQTFSGTGRAKFGFGVYLTESFETAAHYSVPAAPEHYVYTVNCPDLTLENHLVSAQPVNPEIVAKAETKLGFCLPDGAKLYGKYFRKCIGNYLTTGKLKFDKASIEAEQTAAKFLLSIDVQFNSWPQAQTKPDGLKNLAVFNPDILEIRFVDQVELDGKGHLVRSLKHKKVL